jgi:hypothetical protein
MPGYLPLWLCQATAPCRTHEEGFPSLRLCRTRNHWDPGQSAALDPSPEPVPQLAGIPTPWAHHLSGPPEPQLHVGWPDPCPSDSRPSVPAGLQLWVELLEPSPAGTGTSLAWDNHIHQLTRNPAPQAELAPALQAFQITASPDSG